MSIKLIALDLDYTLLTNELKISPRDLEALAEAERRGVKVTIATGRMFKSTTPFAEELDIKVPLITYNGAYIKDLASQAPDYHCGVPLELAGQVLELARSKGIYRSVFVNDTVCIDHYANETEHYEKRAKAGYEIVGDLQKFLKEEPTKLLFIAEPGVLDETLIEWRGIFGDSLYITKTIPTYLEVMNSQVSKGKALARLAGKLGFSREEVMTVGDNANDVDMIEWAGTGVAMENGTEDARRAADYVTLSNNSGGVAHAVEKFVLEAAQERRAV